MTDESEPLAVGDLIKTNYNTGPYRVVEIKRGCTCPAYLDELNSGGRTLPPAPDHLHITCVKPADARQKGYYWLNRYLEEKGRIRSVDSDDEVIVVGKAAGQLSLFDKGFAR
jgi:hypothetical protein